MLNFEDIEDQILKDAVLAYEIEINKIMDNLTRQIASKYNNIFSNNEEFNKLAEYIHINSDPCKSYYNLNKKMNNKKCPLSKDEIFNGSQNYDIFCEWAGIKTIRNYGGKVIDKEYKNPILDGIISFDDGHARCFNNLNTTITDKELQNIFNYLGKKWDFVVLSEYDVDKYLYDKLTEYYENIIKESKKA